MTNLSPLTALKFERFDTPRILKKVASASRALAELKGVIASIPNQGILINTLGLQEAKDSSAIENIVTTHDELYKDDLFPETIGNPAAKEVQRYRQALRVGFEAVVTSRLITNNTLLEVQSALECNNAGFRKLPGTVLKDGTGRTVYTPPQDHRTVVSMMSDLEQFINDESIFPDVDPLIKMALIHHQFESIHPFYDGNGRTGRILNVLYLVKQQLLDIPVLYLSRYIVRTKVDYYNLLQGVRDADRWEDWVMYMLTAIEHTASDAIVTIHDIQTSILKTKHRIRAQHKFYSQDLINSLFSHPYTKIGFIMRDLKVSRITATKYLDLLTSDGFLAKQKVGTSNYYINLALFSILTR